MGNIRHISFSLLSIVLLSLTSQAQNLEWAWAASAGGNDYDTSYGMATDADGNVFVLGYFQSASITLGSITLNNTNSGSGDIFVVKYNIDGEVQWAKSMGGSYADYGLGMTSDNEGNIFITGEFNSLTIAFDEITLTNQSGSNYKSDIFLAKYDTDGNALWATSSGGNERDFGIDLATDDDGNVYMTGMYRSDNISFGIHTFSADEEQNFFIAKYDTNGNPLWARSGDGSSDDEGNAITVDSDGNATIVGVTYSPTFTIGAYIFTNQGMKDVFIASYDTNGNLRWALTEGSSNNEHLYGVVSDNDGNIYVFGHYESASLTLGSNTFTLAGFRDIFLAKYSTDGNIEWAKSPSGSGWEDAQDIAIDSVGNLYIAGFYNSPTLSIDSQTINNAGSATQDIYLAKLNSDGTALWAKSAGGTSNDYGCRILPIANDEVYMNASFTGNNVHFGSTILNSSGDWDIVTAKLSDAVSGIENIDTNEIVVYPNPFSNQAVISSVTSLRNATIVVENLIGERVKVMQNISGNTFTLSRNGLEAGCYSLRLINENEIITTKLVVVN